MITPNHCLSIFDKTPFYFQGKKVHSVMEFLVWRKFQLHIQDAVVDPIKRMDLIALYDVLVSQSPVQSAKWDAEIIEFGYLLKLTQHPSLLPPRKDIQKLTHVHGGGILGTEKEGGIPGYGNGLAQHAVRSACRKIYNGDLLPLLLQ